VGERFGADAAGSHSLEPVVPHGGGSIQSRGDVASIHDSALAGGVAPNPGKAIGLEFQTDGELVGSIRISFFQVMDFRFDAEQLLYVMADLMSDDVGLSELAGRTEAVAQFVEEAEIQINLFVFGAIKGADGFTSEAATGSGSIAKENQPGVVVRSAGGLREDVVPVALDIVENKGDEFQLRLLALILSPIGNGPAGFRCGRAGEVAEEILMKDEAENAEDDDAADAEVGRSDTEASPAAA